LSIEFHFPQAWAHVEQLEAQNLQQLCVEITNSQELWEGVSFVQESFAESATYNDHGAISLEAFNRILLVLPQSLRDEIVKGNG
jgi:hypothetical protein